MFLPVNILLCASTVALGYHHLPDSVAALAVYLAMNALFRWHERALRNPKEMVAEPPNRRRDVGFRAALVKPEELHFLLKLEPKPLPHAAL